MEISNWAILKAVVGNMIKREFMGFTLFVTSVCNLRCKYCFNLDNLGKGNNDLTFDEISLLADHLPDINGMIYSGGEPLLREEIVELSEMFIGKNHVKGFGVPSNCVDGDNTLSKIEKIANLPGSPGVVVCCGLDVFPENHNTLRGKGTYDKVVATIKELIKLKASTPNLSVLVNSVVGKSSVPEISDFVKFVRSISPDLHTLEVVRVDKMPLLETEHDKDVYQPDQNDCQNLDSEEFEEVKKARLLIDKLYRKSDLFYQLYRIRTKAFTDIQRDVILHDRQWPSTCLAGKTSFVIQSNGDVQVCENHAPVGNLRKDGFDPFEIIRNNAQGQFQKIQNHVCDCTHFVNLKETLEHKFPSIFMKHILGQGSGSGNHLSAENKTANGADLRSAESAETVGHSCFSDKGPN